MCPDVLRSLIPDKFNKLLPVRPQDYRAPRPLAWRILKPLPLREHPHVLGHELPVVIIQELEQHRIGLLGPFWMIAVGVEDGDVNPVHLVGVCDYEVELLGHGGFLFGTENIVPGRNPFDIFLFKRVTAFLETAQTTL